MKAPLLSVIVPVYNAEKTLNQCVDSILKQEFREFELILVDDGSKDASSAICDEYAAKDSRVKVFHKENGGVSSARNLGLDHAQGEWITFIDSDDFITEGYLDGVDGKEEDILIREYKCFNEKVTWGGTEVFFRISSIMEFLGTFITSPIIRAPWSKFYKKSVVGDLRFIRDMKIGEDAYFVFKYLAKCNGLAFLPQGYYLFRVSDKPNDVKYAITVDYAVQSLKHLHDAFEGLVQAHGIDKSLFLSFIGYYKRISYSDWENDKTKWYRNKEIKELYDYVWPSLSVKQRFRIVLTRFL